MAANYQDAIVLFGDSLTQSWDAGSLAHRMSEAYSRKLDVLNRGYGGYTSEWALPIFDQIFAKKEEQSHVPAVRLVTIWFGANDACLPGLPQHLDLAKYSSNLNHYLTALTTPTSPYHLPNASILLITPPPVVESMRDEQRAALYPPEDRYKDRTLEVTRGYKDEVLRIAKEWGVEGKGKGEKWKVGVVDVWKGLVEAAGGEGEELRPFFSDGLHLTAPGYSVLFNQIISTIQTDFAGRGLGQHRADGLPDEDLPLRMPHWADVDPKRSRVTVEQGAKRGRDEL